MDDNVGGITYANGVWTVPEAGHYMLAMNVTYTAAASGGTRRTAAIQLNGTAIAQVDIQSTNGQVLAPACMTTKVLAAGDGVTFATFQNSGATVALNTNPAFTWASVTKLSGLS